MNSLINAFRIFADKILLSFQTIQEQQKVIRRLLKKTNSNNSSDSLKHFSLNGNSEEYNDLTGETITFIENFLKNILEKKNLAYWGRCQNYFGKYVPIMMIKNLLA